MISIDVIFFVLVFIALYIASRSALIIGNKTDLTNYVGLFAPALILTGVLVLIFVLFKIGSTDRKDNFNFEVTPEKLCEGGPYMWTSNPAKQKFCSQFTPEQMAQVDCRKGFSGRPVHWNHTNMSNDMWENEMCSDTSFSPCVL